MTRMLKGVHRPWLARPARDLVKLSDSKVFSRWPPPVPSAVELVKQSKLLASPARGKAELNRREKSRSQFLPELITALVCEFLTRVRAARRAVRTEICLLRCV